MKTYYYVVSGQQAGPLSGNDLRAHGVQANTLVWCDSMPTWAPAASVPELVAFFQPLPPPLPSLSASNRAAPTADKPMSPPPLAAQQLRGLPTRQTPRPAGTASHPQFSAEASRCRWWHYLLPAVVMIALMLLWRAMASLWNGPGTRLYRSGADTAA